MSFALECKEELMTIKRNANENIALLLGMVISGAKTEDEKLCFRASNLEVTNYLLFLIKRLYGYDLKYFEEDIQSEKFLHTYQVCVSEVKELMTILAQLHSYQEQIKKDVNLISAYLGGAFLARGSVNDPISSKYHFEITVDNPNNAMFIQQILNEYEFNAKITRRRTRLVIYIKDAEKIVDVLRLIKVKKQAFHYEDIRIERDFNNSINRVINCEVANAQKSLEAANEQLKYIKYLEYNYPLEKLDPKLLTLMKIRKDNPEATLVELIEIYARDYGETISKPGLSHRFAKLKSLAIEHKKNRG